MFISLENVTVKVYPSSSNSEDRERDTPETVEGFISFSHGLRDVVLYPLLQAEHV